MLRQLDIRDLLLIDHVSLDFHAGLNVLTGETGAGKSILLDALGFVLGWRGRAELVRAGAAQGEVIAVFDTPAGHPARRILDELGMPSDEELILRRVNTADGRKTAWINDRRASGEVLRALSAVLVEIHGQQDDRGLLDPAGHRALLDAFGKTDPQREAVRAAWNARRQARSALAQAEAETARLAAEEEFLRHAVAEFDKLAPGKGEEEQLDAARRLMQGAARIRDDIARAYQAVGGDGAEGIVADAIRRLDGAAAQAEGRLDAPLEALSRAIDALGEAEQGIAACLDALDFDPLRLEATEERLFALRALARKHNILPDELATFGDTLREKLATLDEGSRNQAELQKKVAEADRAYTEAAKALTLARHAAGSRLAQAMAVELPPLKLDRASFAVSITPDEPGPEGMDAVVFMVSTNPGAPAGALNRIASGGELSRFLLALKVCLTDGAEGITMIFDEIDRGVGGATADAIGRRLSRLAQEAQVLVVTHSPQVAAMGQQHLRVEKSVADDMTTSRVVALDAEGRTDEIARMLAGDIVSDAARAAAEALIAGAGPA